jgi:hypothetical protein
MGVDPGVNGGIAVIRKDSTPINVTPLDPKMTQREVVELFRIAACDLFRHHSWVAYHEKVGYIKGDGGKGANTFGRIDGILRGAALGLGVIVRDVAPMIWQAKLGCLTGGNKRITLDFAKKLWPDIKITHKTADALLIAEYARRYGITDKGI